MLLDGEDVTALIRTPEVAQAASKVALVPGVRKVLVAEQRRAGERGGVVMEGRDIGSVVFPDAQLKIFLTASPEVRADRRWREHQQKGDAIDLARTLEEIHERDRRDLQRATSPLIRAKDAVVVDSTAMESEEVARLVVMLANEQANCTMITGDIRCEGYRCRFRDSLSAVRSRWGNSYGIAPAAKLVPIVIKHDDRGRASSAGRIAGCLSGHGRTNGS